MVPAESTQVAFYESHMLSFLSANKNTAYNYLELGNYLKMSRRNAKNIARRLNKRGCVILKKMKGTRHVRCGFERDSAGNKKPSYKDKEMDIAYVLIDRKWLESQLPPETPAAKVG